MPAIDFPASPSVNDEYSFEGRTWLWNGTGWEVKPFPAALQLGTAANPSLYFTGDPNTGIYSPGADQVAISTNGTGRLFVDASGNVGLGTSSPDASLDVNGSTYFRTFRGLNIPNSANKILAGSTSTPNNGATPFNALSLLPSVFTDQVRRVVLVYKANDGSSTYELKPFNFTSKTFSSGYGQGYYIGVFDYDGSAWVQDGSWLQLGFNPASAAFALSFPDSSGGVTKAASFSGFAAITDYAVVSYDLFLSMGGFNVIDTNFRETRFSTAGTERMRIDSSGRVGIGTTSPGGNLDVASTGAATNVIVSRSTAGGQAFLSAAGNGSTVGSTSFDFIQDGTGIGYVFNRPAQPLIFGTNNAERARIDNSGRVLINTSTASGAATLQVQTPTTLSTTADTGVGLVNTSTKTYPTTASYSVTAGFSQSVELGTAQTVDTVTPGGFNFVIGLRNTLTKSAGNVQDIERLYFNGFSQSFTWTDANTCKQYIGISDNFSYQGIDANGRTSSFLGAQSLALNVPNGGTQTIANTTGYTNTALQVSNATGTINITSAVGVTPGLNIRALTSGTLTASITNYTFLGTSTSWGTFANGTGVNAATITNLYGLRLTAPGVSTGLTVTNNWGISQEWALAKNYFAGSVGIGTTSPGSALEINAAAATSPFIAKINTAEAARIDSSGRLLVGTSTSIGFGEQIQAHNTSGDNIAVGRFSANTGAPDIRFYKSRGSLGTNTIVAADDALGAIDFRGADGSSYILAARIRALVDGTPGTNDMPCRLVFSVTADGASSPTEALRIKNSRIINIANTPVYADNAAAKTGGLVDGDVYRKSDGTLMIVYT